MNTRVFQTAVTLNGKGSFLAFLKVCSQWLHALTCLSQVHSIGLKLLMLGQGEASCGEMRGRVNQR